MSTELIRQRYKPDKIKVLLVGESAPAAGTFFYTVDTLTNFTQEAFRNVFEEVKTLGGYDFLNWFKEKGFYLDDLCLNPVNSLDKATRVQSHKDSIESLVNRLKEYKPQVIIVMLKGIVAVVDEVIRKAEPELGEYLFFDVPFGGNGHQNEYINELTDILIELQRLGII